MNKKISLYFGEENAKDMPIYSREIDFVWCLSGNTGAEDSDGWYSTDEGFIPLENMESVLGMVGILDFAKKNSAFYDIRPKTGKGEWYFSNGKKAKIFYNWLCQQFVLAGYELIK